MADEFREYSGSSDKAAIFEGLRSKFSGFNRKELGFIGAAIGLFVLVLVLGAFVGVERSNASFARSQAARLEALCQDKVCLEAAAWSLANVNASVAPCDNFYQYACGNYKNVKPLDAETLYHDILHDMYLRNRDKLVNLMESPVKDEDWASEKKLKDLFTSCNDQFTREKKRGKPLVDLINSKLGGWAVLGNWDASNWNFHTVLKTVQDDLWTAAFWRYYVVADWHDRGKYTVGFYPSGTGKYLPWSYYNRQDALSQKAMTDYQKFMRRVAQLLQRDANVTSMSSADKAQKVEEFVTDAFAIEQKLALAARTTRYQPKATAPENRITLANLKTQTSGVIDFVEVATYLFDGGAIGPDSPVIVWNLDYLKQISQMISQLPPADKPRMLHNYLVWRVMESYTWHLSWEYLHADKELFADLHSYREFPSLWDTCFSIVSTEMDEALGALFVMDHFPDKDRAKVTEITETMKLALEDTVSNTPWMDDDTRKTALAKAKKVTYKLGYPDRLMNKTAVNAIYAPLTVDRGDYMGNVLAVNQFRKQDFKRKLIKGENRDDWYFRTFDTNMAILWYWNEIIIPAGFFQFPLYDYRLPHYLAFGGLGSDLGHFVTHVVDTYGAKWDERGMLLDDPWWSNATRDAYKEVRQCMVDIYNTTQGPYIDPASGESESPRMDAEGYADESLAMTAGVRLSYKAFKMWEKQHGADKTAPGLGLTNHQTFFLAYAQDYCSNMDDRLLFWYGARGIPSHETQINMVLQQLEEFSSAFSCPADSAMNPSRRCQLY